MVKASLLLAVLFIAVGFVVAFFSSLKVYGIFFPLGLTILLILTFTLRHIEDKDD